MSEGTKEGWVERDSRVGRRKDDLKKCAMHDFLFDKNEDCFNFIKKTIQTEIRSRDHKFELLEKKLENFISKWAIGVIITVTLILVGSMFGFASWQIQIMSNKIDGMIIAISTIGTKQTGVIKQLDELMPEHRRLMEHLNRGESP